MISKKAKPVHWIASAHKAVKAFPEEVRSEIGFSLYQAELGGRAVNAVPMVGFNGKVMEIIVDDDGDTFRAVYTVRFEEALYVVHAFQKKSKRGSKTPQHDMEVIRSRLKLAEQDYKLRYGEENREKKHGQKS